MKNLRMVLAIMAIILFLFNLYFITENQKLNKRIAILESQIKSFQSEKSFQDKNENYPVLEEEDIEYQELVDSVTKDWNIYRNEVYGFEIKYPEKNKGTFEKFDEPIVKNELASFWWSFEQKNRADFAIYIYIKNTESLIQKVKKSIYPHSAGELKNIYAVIINNEKVYQVVTSCDFSIVSTFVENDNYVYEFSLIKPETPEDIIEYNQIVSTFKFIEK